MRGRPNKYPVKLTSKQRAALRHLLRVGKSPTNKLTHARILLKAHRGWTNERISDSLEVSVSTVSRVRARFGEQGIRAALEHRKPVRKKPRRLDGRAEAHLISLACSSPPQGCARWTLRLLADELVELNLVPSVARETVRKVLKKKCAHAAPAQAVVHPARAKRSLRLRDGGGAGHLPAAL